MESFDDYDDEYENTETNETKYRAMFVNNRLFYINDDKLDELENEKEALQNNINNCSLALQYLKFMNLLTASTGIGAGIISAVNLTRDLLSNTSPILNTAFLGASACIVAGGYIYTRRAQKNCILFHDYSIEQYEKKETEYNEIVEQHKDNIEKRENYDKSYN